MEGRGEWERGRIRVYKSASTQVCEYTSLRVHESASPRVYESTSLRVYKYTSILFSSKLDKMISVISI
jgi:hypothetical protein